MPGTSHHWSRFTHYFIALGVLAFLLTPAMAGAQEEAVDEPAAVASEPTVVPTEPPLPTNPPPPPPTNPPPPAPTDPPPPVATEPPVVVPTEPPPVVTEPPVVVPTEPVTTPKATTPAVTEPAPATENAGIPPTEAVDPSVTPEATASSTPTETPTPSPSPSPTATPPPPAALGLPWPLPSGYIAIYGGGPLNGLAMIWNYGGFGISQEYGHTAFSVAHPDWYNYGTSLGLDGYAHPGIDISMPRGTWLYSPVNGTVVVSGNSSGYTFYGNGGPNVGQLRIRTDSGNEVILGHMGRIAVNVGEYVQQGQFVGVSGGFNGDHLHLETREVQSGSWYRAVDPRQSFLVAAITNGSDQPAELEEVATESAAEETVPTEVPALETTFEPNATGDTSTDTTSEPNATGDAASVPASGPDTVATESVAALSQSSAPLTSAMSSLNTAATDSQLADSADTEEPTMAESLTTVVESQLATAFSNIAPQATLPSEQRIVLRGSVSP